MKRVKRIKYYLIIVLTAVLLFTQGCEEEKPDINKLVGTYVDLSIAREKLSEYPDSLQFVKDSIYNKYDLSEEEFKTKMKNLKASSEIWDRFFIQANKYLDSVKAVNSVK